MHCARCFMDTVYNCRSSSARSSLMILVHLEVIRAGIGTPEKWAPNVILVTLFPLQHAIITFINMYWSHFSVS